MNIPCRICVYCLLLFGYEGYSQSSSLYFHHLDKNSGIPQSVCNDIYRDSRGFVWITTISGLYRFDGTQFIDVLKEDETLKSHALRDIAEDKNGSLWLTKNDDELVNFNPYRGTAEIISLRSFLQPQNISVIGLNLLHVDEYNRLWIGINGKGIACFDIKTRLLKIILMPVAGIDVITFFFSKENLFKSVLFKKTPGSDLVYQGTFDAELNIKWVFKQNPEMHGSEFIYASDTCNVWYAEKNNLVQYNWQTNTISRYYFLSKTPQDLLQGMMFLDNKRKRLWISFKHGITCFDIAQKKITQRYEHDPSDPYSIKEGSLPVLDRKSVV